MRTMTPEQIKQAAEDLEAVSARLMAVLNETPANYVVLGILTTALVIVTGEINSNDEGTRGEYTMDALRRLKAELDSFLRSHLGEAGLAYDVVRIQ